MAEARAERESAGGEALPSESLVLLLRAARAPGGARGRARSRRACARPRQRRAARAHARLGFGVALAAAALRGGAACSLAVDQRPDRVYGHAHHHRCDRRCSSRVLLLVFFLIAQSGPRRAVRRSRATADELGGLRRAPADRYEPLPGCSPCPASCTASSAPRGRVRGQVRGAAVVAAGVAAAIVLVPQIAETQARARRRARSAERAGRGARAPPPDRRAAPRRDRRAGGPSRGSRVVRRSRRAVAPTRGARARAGKLAARAVKRADCEPLAGATRRRRAPRLHRGHQRPCRRPTTLRGGVIGYPFRAP